MSNNADEHPQTLMDISDRYDRLAETSRNYVNQFRSLLIELGERHTLPKRFQVYPCSDKVAMKIVDTETGRSAEVVLSAYGDVRKVLTLLFDTSPTTSNAEGSA
jgi:hypothetical protein